MAQRVIHQLAQGSPEWHAHRANHYNASEAAAAAGISPYQTRQDLLKEKATGLVREHSADDLRRFDGGHKFEAIARPWAEDIIGEDLYPITASLEVAGLPLSASYDGTTIAEDITFEHKQLNQELAAALEVGEIPAKYKPQMEQQLLILGAKKCLFMASNGSRETMKFAWYESDPKVRRDVIANWKQFDADRAEYVHVDVKPAAVGEAVESLPMPQVQVNGDIAIVSNLTIWGAKLHEFIAGINMKPQDDQDFANAEVAVKKLQDAQDALELAEKMALLQTASIEELRSTVAFLVQTARDTRLKLEKMVKAEKENIRAAILKGGQDKLTEHVAKLNTRLGKPFMPPIPADFAGAMKGKKSLASLRDAVDTTLAKAKIIANEAADAIDINCRVLAAIADEFKPLFPDAAHLVLKASDDLQAVVDSRIAAAKEATAKRVEEERARAEAAQAKLDVAPAAAPAAANVVQMASRPAGATPTLKLGQIGERLGFTLSADFLKGLGFEGVKDRSSLLFHEADFGNICAALVRHIEAIQAKQVA